MTLHEKRLIDLTGADFIQLMQPLIKEEVQELFKKIEQPDRYLTIKQAAEYLSCSTDKIRKMLFGKIPAEAIQRDGKFVRIKKSAIQNNPQLAKYVR